MFALFCETHGLTRRGLYLKLIRFLNELADAWSHVPQLTSQSQKADVRNRKTVCSQGQARRGLQRKRTRRRGPLTSPLQSDCDKDRPQTL